MATKKKNWREKLNDSKDLPKVVELNADAQMHWHGKTMVVPAPLEVDALMKKVPKGKLVTIDLIRQKLAKDHKCDIGCPLTTGIFAWIAAGAAAEDLAEGVPPAGGVTPYWRTLKTGGELNPKYPGGVSEQKEMLEQEGHKVIQKGKKWLVLDLEKSLVKL